MSEIHRSHAGILSGSGNSKHELVEALKSARGEFVHLGAFSFFVNLLMLTGPLYMLQVYDRVLASQSVPTLTALTLLALILYATMGGLEWVRSNLFNGFASRFEDLLGDRAANASLELSLSDAGRASDKPLRDLRQLRRFFSSPVLNAVFDAPWSPLFFVVLFMMHPFFGVWAVFGALVLAGLSVLNQKTSAHLLKESEERERAAQQRALEMVQNAEVITALGMQENVKQRWREAFDGSDDNLLRSGRRLAGFTAATKTFRLFLQSAILGIGAWLIIASRGGASSHGEMVAASILMGRAIAPIEQIVGQWRSIVFAHEAWGSLKRFLDRAVPTPEKMELPSITGRLAVEAAFAAPPGIRKPVLRGLNFQLEPGDVLGVLGPSAAGKSTLARVLTGVWPVSAGSIRLDGADIGLYGQERLGKQIGYLPQQVDLLSGTVRDNISRFDPSATAEEIIEAARLAACHELILGLPNGYDTEIGRAGAYLSAGQRQRVGLARALFRNPGFVVLDEPNSNLDSPGEEALKQAVAQLSQQKATSIIIAHRPNTVMQCNKLLVLDGGEIRLFGPRDEVLGKIMPKSGGANVTSMKPRTESHV
jgi:PrtD family type I secretion system ABC transporter